MDSCIEWHVMQVNKHYWKILVVVMSIMRISLKTPTHVGGHVLQMYTKAATIEAAVSLDNWCFFFFLLFLVFTCFARIYCLKCSCVCRFIFVVCLIVFFWGGGFKVNHLLACLINIFPRLGLFECGRQ